MGTSVFVVDQERTFADAMTACLDAEDDIAVVGTAYASAPAMSVIAGRHADILLLDGDIEDGAAIRICEELSVRDDAPRVIMLSATCEADRIVAAVRAGVAAWVGKDESLEHLLRVIRGVARGETWLPPAAMGQVLRLLEHQREEPDDGRLVSTLTPRERQVLVFLAEGFGRRDVAQRMCLSVNTVRTHVQNLLAKLGVHSTVEAVAVTRGHLDRVHAGPGSNR